MAELNSTNIHGDLDLKDNDLRNVASINEVDVPDNAKFTGVISSSTEPALNTGDEWHKEI